ncbi:MULTISPECIES: hypothetical protein [unclassified Bacillus (in: firmicutes)]|uniref:hypothetical protein n=1 Tax=unclassified Bacillus (in: firmicutes) TaxID=185979 RepID=UPI000BF03B46|nr:MULTISPECIES: hypothetical protein [unclassified Bacillus (in: firmicutes)]PEJ53139.1 hypothetical protein CN692_21585 [Bacillus sp. AFS002410]PEL03256.1 hypothetical protein CN601_22020 [Bacillus sp. AFS017336]
MFNQEEKEKYDDLVKLHIKIFGEKMTQHFLVEGKKNNRYESDYPIFLINYKAGKFLLEMYCQKLSDEHTTGRILDKLEDEFQEYHLFVERNKKQRNK